MEYTPVSGSQQKSFKMTTSATFFWSGSAPGSLNSVTPLDVAQCYNSMYTPEPFACELQQSSMQQPGTCTSCSPIATARIRDKKKKIGAISVLWTMNLALCLYLLFVEGDYQLLLVISFMNIGCVLLASIAILVEITQLVVVCIIYKLMTAFYLSLLVCKMIDSVVGKSSHLTQEDIWATVALLASTLEIWILCMFKTVKEDRSTMPPPKYSSCALQSASGSPQPPSYDEAVRMIEQQRCSEVKVEGSSELDQQSIYTLQRTEPTKSLFRTNLCI